jgi:hypothetical protein
MIQRVAGPANLLLQSAYKSKGRNKGENVGHGSLLLKHMRRSEEE